ncbi:MAG: M28 family metallopeptidase [Pseudomonadota bacterium]
MIKFRVLFAVAATALISACASSAPPLAATSVGRIRSDVAFLADDARMGREAGTAGYDEAAGYVAKRMKQSGLKPASRAGWRQEVPLRSSERDLGAARLSFSVGAEEAILVHLEDFIIGRTYNDETFSMEAPLVYAGYGVSAPEEGVDDYAGVDAAGKIVVVFSGAPPALNTEKRAHYSSGEVKLETAAAHGAVGFISMPSKKDADETKWTRAVNGVSTAGMTFIESDGRAHVAAPSIKASANLSAAGAEKLFAGERLDYTALQAKEAEGKGAPAGFNLTKTGSLSGGSVLADARSANIIGMIEGSDPALKNEVILLTAHLDHIGISKSAKPGEDAINNGALDNSGGVAVLLETASRFARAGTRPRRTIAFAAVTAEEKGLIGSDYLARNPAFGGKRVVANVNLDMPIALYPFTDVIAFGAERSSIGAVVAEAAKSMGVALSPDPIPEENIFVRSDHYSFVKQGAPAVFLVPGFANGGAEAFGAFLKKHYHKPSDDLSLPIDYDALARFSDLNYRIARGLANAPVAPDWAVGDFFGTKFAR